ncbi:sigma-54-dependent Fis family transcriptional regulator [Porphyromonas sp. COT-239 OH1446]|uniref:sigma-54 interaction domain-containing protein n=1 Tax=Porphyromonas sp. COT-239 OH1446 TaxID=1515613 RepID=UPI00052B720A|nr:sigma-54 dependent transcriptional regulator [Porphyromonas sp. COT-239 OH1446]KGN71956.1 ATPase AAA [Porphyromonas sp. COT-239 OH1446]
MNTDTQQVKQRFGIIGSSPLLERALQVALQVAPTDMSVLVMGESGVGKEIFPKIIHQHSARKHGPYIAVNCGAIPEGTIDSELFGHLKGSFTGAITDRKGYFQEASSGTIFLDEVGELPMATQARLLRVLETGEFIPVGASAALRTDVRIVAATNVNLREAVARGRFREDLLFRLNTVPIEVPPLRSRSGDIALLFRYFAAQSSERYSMPPLRLTPEARALLEQYRWPGNIRELRNLTDRISVLEAEREISAETLARYLEPETPMELHPALRLIDRADASSGFSNEREILYQVLFDLRKDVAELKSLIGKIMQGKVKIPSNGELGELSPSEFIRPTPPPRVAYEADEASPYVSTLPPSARADVEEVHTIELIDEPTPEIQLSPRTLEQVEREEITSALLRHSGRRRAAAKDLKISERTLYRKIKEYGLEDL